MTSTDQQLDRIVESLQQVNLNFEGLRVTLSSLAQVSEDHEQRIRSIERWKHHLTPIVAAITFLLGGIVSVVIDRLM